MLLSFPKSNGHKGQEVAAVHISIDIVVSGSNNSDTCYSFSLETMTSLSCCPDVSMGYGGE